MAKVKPVAKPVKAPQPRREVFIGFICRQDKAPQGRLRQKPANVVYASGSVLRYVDD